MLPNDHEASTTTGPIVDSERREFLRTSVYAAYATPLITMLLVDAHSAAASPGRNNCPSKCSEFPDDPGCDGCW